MVTAYERALVVGTLLYKFGKQGRQDGHFLWLRGMLLDSSSNLLVCDFDNNQVQQFCLDGHFTGKTNTVLLRPVGIATAPDQMDVFSQQA